VDFQARLTDRARWELDHLGPEAASQILDCIDALTRNPSRDIDQRVTLVVPLDRVYRDAYRCGDWAIGYDSQDDDTLLIKAIGSLFY
jgi:mRNA-degrading endonuclease RelE of RelBE toxin-antitoxin system